MIRTNQGGSVASFIIVAALLVLGTAGLLYFVKRGDAPKSGAPQVAVSDKKGTPENPNNSGQKVDENNDSTTQRGNSTPQTSGRTSPNNRGNSGTTNQGPSVGELSRTGPADTLAQVVMVGILAAALVAYLQSRSRFATDRSSL